MEFIKTCGIKINPESYRTLAPIAQKWLIEGRKGIQITGINIEQIALLKKDPNFATYVNASDIVNIDGTIVMAFIRICKRYKNAYRGLCANYLYHFLDFANAQKRSVYFLGASQEVVEQVVDNIHRDYPNIEIVGFHNGYFTEDAPIVDEIKAVAPDFLFIGMPSPTKERFIYNHKAELNAGVCFGVGGMFDIIAGKAKRAPAFWQAHGLEWMYRISQNPVGHTKRVFNALIPGCCVFIKDIFSKN